MKGCICSSTFEFHLLQVWNGSVKGWNTSEQVLNVYAEVSECFCSKFFVGGFEFAVSKISIVLLQVGYGGYVLAVEMQCFI